MINPLEFRKYAGWPISATASSGSLLLSRIPPPPPSPGDEVPTPPIISFPALAGHFFTSSMEFYNSAEFTLSSDEQMISVDVVSRSTGASQNIPPGVSWDIPYYKNRDGSLSRFPDLLVTNPRAFTGGADVVAIRVVSDTLSKNISDQQIESYIDISQAVVRDMLGYEKDESLPESPRITNAIFFLCLFYLENQSSQERAFTFSLGQEVVTEKKTSYYRANLEPMIYRRVVQMIGPWRKAWRFVPPYKDPAEAS